MKTPIELQSDLSEELAYNIPDFPLYIRKNRLSAYGFQADAHWHKDLEFVEVIRGNMDFFVDGEVTRLSAGQGIFVNSKRLHYGFSNFQKECVFYAVIINPELFFNQSLSMRDYLDAKFGPQSENFLLVDDSSDWGENVLSKIRKLYTEYDNDDRNYLRVLSLATSICADITDRLAMSEKLSKNDDNKNIVWKMVDYIQKNYQNKISLNDIAASGTVCRNKCCQLLKKYLNQSPNDFLLDYRLSRSYQLLSHSELTISEIALNIGFQDASYFTSVFKKKVGKTPSQYRFELNG